MRVMVAGLCPGSQPYSRRLHWKALSTRGNVAAMAQIHEGHGAGSFVRSFGPAQARRVSGLGNRGTRIAVDKTAGLTP